MSRFTHFCPFQLPMGTAGGSLGQKTSFLALLGGGILFLPVSLWVVLVMLVVTVMVITMLHPMTKNHTQHFGDISPFLPIFLPIFPFLYLLCLQIRYFFNPIWHVFNQNTTILTPNTTNFPPLWTFSPKTWRYFPLRPQFLPHIWTFLCHRDSNMGAFNLLSPFLPQILPFLNILWPEIR